MPDNATFAAPVRLDLADLGNDRFDALDLLIPGCDLSGLLVEEQKSPDEIQKMGDDDLKKFTPEEIKGMSLDQFQRFTEAVEKDGALEGKGMMGLDPDQRKAMLRKTIMKGLMEYFASQADKHTSFNPW